MNSILVLIDFKIHFCFIYYFEYIFVIKNKGTRKDISSRCNFQPAEALFRDAGLYKRSGIVS